MSARMQHGYLRKAFAERDDFLFLAAMLWLTPNGWGDGSGPFTFDFAPK